MQRRELPTVSYNLGFAVGFDNSPLRPGTQPTRYHPPAVIRRNRLYFIRGFVAGAMSPGRHVRDYVIWPPCPDQLSPGRTARVVTSGGAHRFNEVLLPEEAILRLDRLAKVKTDIGPKTWTRAACIREAVDLYLDRFLVCGEPGSYSILDCQDDPDA